MNPGGLAAKPEAGAVLAGVPGDSEETASSLTSCARPPTAVGPPPPSARCSPRSPPSRSNSWRRRPPSRPSPSSRCRRRPWSPSTAAWYRSSTTRTGYAARARGPLGGRVPCRAGCAWASACPLSRGHLRAPPPPTETWGCEAGRGSQGVAVAVLLGRVAWWPVAGRGCSLEVWASGGGRAAGACGRELGSHRGIRAEGSVTLLLPKTTAAVSEQLLLLVRWARFLT